MTDFKHEGLAKFQADAQVLTQPKQSALYANQSLHPTKVMQDNALVNKERKRLQEMSVCYGSHMAMRHVIESSILSQVQRPSGYRSNMFGLNHHLGRFYELDSLDIYNDPNGVPYVDKVGQRERMEQEW